MAEELFDGEFWLPPQFLTDDDLLMDFKNKGNDNFSFGFNRNSFGPNSDLSSPVESVIGSTETESDEDDYLSEVTRKLLQSTLQDSKIPMENSKGRMLSRSPQSTLCGAMAARGSNFMSSGGSPNCVSLVSSPPGMNRIAAANWDMLYEAAGELARMRLVEETAGFYTGNRGAGGVFGAPERLNPISVHDNTHHSSGYYPNQAPQISYRQLLANQFQQLKQQQIMKQQQHGSGVWGQGKGKGGYPQMVPNVRRNGGERPQPRDLSMAAWPTLQQSQRHPEAGMRAMFLGDPGTKRERAGTGVFLPRRLGTPSETRKKPGSTVLLPDRVVQALNLNLDSIDSHPQIHSRGAANPNPDSDGLKSKNNVGMGQKMHSVRLQPVMSQEFRLPQEWTY